MNIDRADIAAAVAAHGLAVDEVITSENLWARLSNPCSPTSSAFAAAQASPSGPAATGPPRSCDTSDVVESSSTSVTSRSRVARLQANLRDERSGRVVFVSHCLLNENTRYLGGAFRSGVVDEVVGTYVKDGTGICQMPCPEQLVWGGVLKRRLLVLYGRPWLRPVIRPVLPALRAYTTVRYRLLARRVAGQIADYQRSGFDVVGVVGVDASPTCGVTTTLDLGTSLDAIVGCPAGRFDRRFMNDTVVDGATRPGRGLFIDALHRALARRGHQVALLRHDLRSEAPDSPLTPGTEPAGVAGSRRTRRPPRTMVAATRAVLRPRLGDGPTRDVIAEATSGFDELAERIPQQLNRGGHHLLTQSAFTIAVYRALTERGTEPRLATEAVSDIVFEANSAPHRWLHRVARLRHRDPWRRLRWQSSLRCSVYTAPAWELHEASVDDGYGLDVTRCAIADYYRDLGLSDLCEQTICAQDERVADQYGTPVGISFTRTGTLAGGADRCDFRYHPTPPHPAQ